MRGIATAGIALAHIIATIIIDITSVLFIGTGTIITDSFLPAFTRVRIAILTTVATSHITGADPSSPSALVGSAVGIIIAVTTTTGTDRDRLTYPGA